jgi:predicted adenylyl cyclase CyaB
MPVNLELKACIPERSPAFTRAQACGAEFRGALLQTDTYFQVASGRLKLREQQQGAAELIHYARSEESSERWSDYQRIPVGDPVGLKSVLSTALGVFAVVKKERQLFLYKGARIHIDNVELLGSFLEFEVPHEGTEDPEVLMRELREIFSVDERAVEKRSYSDLILVKSSLRDA